MGKISRKQDDYIKAYEEYSKTGINVSALINLTEMSYEEKERLVQYKFEDKYRSEDYDSRINTCYRHMISTFLKIDNASPIYNNFKEIYSKVYLDNTDDDTNDYKDETMIKLNKIYNFINNLGDQDLKGTELLSLLRRELSGIDEPLKDDYFDISFEELKGFSKEIQLSSVQEKMELVPKFLQNVGDLESHLFRKKLFYDDYRKSVTGLTNYLFARAGIPEIYIKPIELDEYYSYVTRENSIENNEIVTFYKEIICDSIEDIFIKPMKEAIKYHTDEKFRQESGEYENKIITLRQNKYK